MVVPPVIRPKITQELRERVYQEIINNPEISSREIINNLIEEDPGNVVYFFSTPINESLTLEEQIEIHQCKTKAEKKKMMNKLMRNRKGEFTVNFSVITRIKNSLNKSYAPSTKHGAIYGASNLGYVVEKAMDADRAARWLYPRLSQIQHECLAWNKTAQLLGHSGSPERKDAADAVRKYVNKAMYYKEVKRVTDGVRDHYLRGK